MSQIVFADESDVPELSAMAFRIWREYFPRLLSEDQIEYMIGRFQSESAISGQMASGFEYGFITYNGSRAGYFSVRPEDDSLFINKIYISGDVRGHGLGSCAIKEIEAYARSLNMKRMCLRVNRNNVPSIGFYRKNGFETVRGEKTDIGNGFFMDDLIMERII